MNTNEQNDNKLLDPYANAPDLFRAYFYMSRNDWLWLKSLSPHASNNTLSDRDVTMRVIIKKLINELKRNKITQYDPESFRRAIASVAITINVPSRTGSPIALTGEQDSNGQTMESDNRNDGRGISGVPFVAPQTPPKSTGTGGTSTGQTGVIEPVKRTREDKKRKGVS